MVRTIAFRFVGAAALLVAVAACSSEAPADAPVDAAAEPAVIKERQDNFEAIADAFKLIRGELEKGSPDFMLIGAQAGDINARATKIVDYFPEGTGIDAGYDTEALATIRIASRTSPSRLCQAHCEFSAVIHIAGISSAKLQWDSRRKGSQTLTSDCN